MSRRRFLVGSGLALGLATDLFITRQIQEYRQKVGILTLKDSLARTRFPRTGWLLFPGYKTSWEEALWILGSLQPALRQRGRMAAVGYSNRGLDLDQIFAEVRRHIRLVGWETVYFYGHSFGGMVATEIAARLRDIGVDVRLILLDCSPCTKYDVLDETWFDGVVFLYDHGYRIPSALRGSYELGERIVHKDERTWHQILDQSLEQLSPLAPSSVLIQAESSYIYHFDPSRFGNRLGDTEMVWFGNPLDGTVDYDSARASWARWFPQNLVSNDRVTEGALPAHASPQWNPLVYQELVEQVLDVRLPLPPGGGKWTAF